MLVQVQAEVFSVLRSAPEGDELQLLSKLHKVRCNVSLPGREKPAGRPTINCSNTCFTHALNVLLLTAS